MLMSGADGRVRTEAAREERKGGEKLRIVRALLMISACGMVSTAAATEE